MVSVVQMKETIQEYLDEASYNYAVMLTGDWGSGKTFFVMEQLRPNLECSGKRRFVYVSLYGLKTAEDITMSVMSAILECRLGKKLAPASEAVVKFLAGFAGGKSSNDAVEELKIGDVCSPFIDYDKYFFVFDDLERCSMLVSDVLGYINFFVEQNSAKVLIIANEKEISSIQSQKNLEMKYFLASQNQVVWPEPEEKGLDFYYTLNGRKKETELNAEELKRRVQILFSEDVLYRQIKEKLIGRTIFYEPDIEEILSAMFTKYLGHAMGEVWSDKKQLIAYVSNVLKMENYRNLRTVQAALLFWIKVIDIVREIRDIPDNDCLRETLEIVLRAIIRVMIHYKSGKPSYVWSEQAEYGGIHLNGNLFDIHDYLESFKFIHDYIYHGTFEKERIKSVLGSYMWSVRRKKDEQEDPVAKLSGFWEMEDSEVTMYLETMFQKLEARQYNGTQYRWILSMIYWFKGLGLEPISAERFAAVMEEHIKSGVQISSYQEPFISKDSPCMDEFERKMEYLKECACNYGKVEEKVNLKQLLECSEGWGMKLYQCFEVGKERFGVQKRFLATVEVEPILELIKKSTVKEVSDFRRGLCTIYKSFEGRQCIEGDYEVLQKLNCGLKRIMENGRIKAYNIELLIRELESICRLAFSEE